VYAFNLEYDPTITQMYDVHCFPQVDFIHRKGKVNRDIKLANVRLFEISDQVPAALLLKHACVFHCLNSR